jgi:filamentous hemagglutinin family protein
MPRGATPRPARRPRHTAPIPAPARPPRRRAPQRFWLLATTALLPVAAGQALAQGMPAPNAGPTGGQVTAGQALIAQGGNRTTITQGTNRAAIDWQQFNVGSQHTVQFVQPNQGSWTLNRVVGPDPSVIAGRVQANGGVAIVNQSGMVFARGAQVDVGALIASAPGITNENFMAGRMVFDQAARPGARVENHGTITVADRGLAALVGPGVANSGVIRARLGRVALGAAETFVLDLAGDGLIGIDVTQAVRTAPEGGTALVTNSGVIEAAGGSVLLTAHAASGLVEDLVRHTGRIEAPTVGERTGQVAIRAEGGGARVDGTITATGGAGARGGSVAVQGTGTVTVGAAARIDASGGTGGGRVLVGTTGRGRNQRMAARTTVEAGAEIRADATVRGQGGEILVNSAERTEMRGTLSARGGAQGGDGGFVEISGQQALLISGIIDLAAPSGTPGELLIDPRNIIVSNQTNPADLPGGETIVPPAVATPGASFTASTGAETEWLRIETAAITGFNGTVTLNADRDIIVASDVTKAANQGGLNLVAGRNVTLSAAVSVDGALSIAAGTGAITIGDNLRARSLTMTAGTDIAQTGGNIRHRQNAATVLALSATTASGAITLDQTGNGALAVTFNTTGAVQIRSGRAGGGNPIDGSLTIAGASSGGSVLLTSERGNAGGSLTIDAPLTSLSGVVLAADGAVGQDAAGTIVTSADPALGSLRIRDRANVDTGPASIALAAAANQVAGLDAITTGSLAFRAVGFAEGPGGVPAANPILRVYLAHGSTVSVEAPRILVPTGSTRVAAATGDATLIATEAAAPGDPSATLTIAGAVRAGDGAAVRLRADRMDLTDANFDGTGAGSSLAVLEIGPLTAGRALRFGGADDTASLWLGQTAPIAAADAGLLRLGETTIGGGTVTAGAITIGADLTFAGTLSLTGTGAITQEAGTAIAVPDLVLRGGGSVTLAEAGNQIEALDGRATGALDVASAVPSFAILAAEGSSVTLRGATIALGDAAVTATGPAGRVTLLATAGITQGADGAITAAELAAEAQGGNIALTGSGNDIRTVADALTIAAGNGPLLADAERGLYASGRVELTTQGALTIAGAVESRGGLVALSAGSLQIDAPIAVSGGGATPTLTLLTNSSGGASGAIGSTARILTPYLAVTADGPVSLENAGNAVANLAPSLAAGGFALATSGALAAGDVTAEGRLALRTGGALTIDGTLTAPRIELRAGTTLTQGAGGVLASVSGPTELLAQAGTGNLTLGLAGDVRVVNGGVPGGAGLSAPGSVALTSGGTIEIAARVQGSEVTLAGEAIAIAAPLATPALTGTVTLTATGAGDASTITQTASGVITAGLLTATAEGAIDLSLAPNAVGSLGAFSFTDAFGYRSTTSFTVGAALAPADAGNADITIIADTGAISLLAPIAAGTGTVRLEATTGSITQADAGAAITAGRVEVTAAGDALLAPTIDRNQVDVLGPSTVGGTLAFAAAGGLTLDGVIAQAGGGGSAVIEAGGTLTQNAGGVLAFDGISLSAPQAITLRGTIGIGGPAPISQVRIGAGAGIAIEGAGRILAGALGIRAVGDVTLGVGANDIRGIAAVVTGRFSMDTNGALATTTVTAVPLPGAAAVDITGVTGTHVTLSATDLTINGGGVFGTGASATAPDGVLTLHADRLTMNSLVFAGDVYGVPNLNGTIVVAPRTPGRTMLLGAIDPAALSLVDLTPFLARNLVFGRSEPGSGTLRVAAGVTVSGLLAIDSVALRGGAIALDAMFSLPTSGGLASLVASSGDITQGAAGAVVASRLGATAANGSVRLDGAANQVDEISGGAGGDFAFRGAGNLVVAAPGIAAPDGTVSLSAAGSISQVLGAPIAADRLAVAANGTVVLDGGAGATPADLNRIGTLGPSTSILAFTLRNADPLTVEDLTILGGLGGQVALEAPGLTLAGTITALDGIFLAGRVVLRTGADFDAPVAGTAITQTGGIIRTTNLAVSAGDSVDLRQANEIVRLAAGQSASGATSADSIVLRAGGDFALSRANGSLEVAARVNAGAGGAVRVASNGLTVAPGLFGTVFFAPGGVVRFQPYSAGGTIGLGGPAGFDTASYATDLVQRVQADRLVIGDAGSGTISLRAALDLTGPSGPQALELRSGGNILGNGFNIALREVSAAASGSIALGSAGSAIQRIAAGETTPEGLRAGGSIAIATGGTLAVDAPVIADGPNVTLQAADFVLAPGATVRTGADPAAMIHLRSTAPGGFGLGVAAGASGLTPQEIALLDAQGGVLRLEGQAITLAGTVAVDAAAAGLLDLVAAGAVAQTGGTLAAESLRVSAGSIQIDRAGNDLPQVQATATGNIAIASDGTMTVLGTASTFGTVRLEAGGILLSGANGTAVQAGAGVALTATTGDITGLAGLAAVVAPTLAATAANGAITLTGDNGIGSLTAIAGTGATVVNSGALTATVTGPGGAALAGDVTLRAASLLLGDVLATGTVTLTATDAAVRQQASGRLAAGTLFGSAPGGLGAILLDGSANAVGGIGALAATGDITLRNAQALTIDVPLSVNGFRTLTLEAPTLTLDANLAAGAGGRIVLRTGAFEGGVRSGGDILQTGGTISTPLLAALAGGSVSLDQAGNAIGALGGGSSASGAALGLGLSAGTTAVVRNDAGTLGVVGAIDLAAGGTLLLRADDLAIGAQIRAPNGTITLLPATTNAGIGYVLGGAAGSATAGRITLDGTELGFLPVGAAAELVLGRIGETGDVTIAGPVALATNGTNARVGRLTLAGDGALAQDAGTFLDVAALRATFPNGTVLLDPGMAGNRIAALDGVTAGGDVVLRGGAGMMALRDGGEGAAIVSGGSRIVLRADDLDIQARVQVPGGTVSILPETPGRWVTLGAAGAGTLALDSAEIARIGGGGTTLDTPGAARLRIGSDGVQRTAGNITVAGDVPLRDGASERVGTLELVAGRPGAAGSVRQTGGSVDVAAVTGTAQGDFRLGLASNAFDTASGITAGAIELGTAGDLAATAIQAGTSVRVSAGGALSAGAIGATDILLQGGTVTLTGLIQGSNSVAIDSLGAVAQQAGALIVTRLFTVNGGSILLPEDNEVTELTGLVATGPVLALNTVLPLLVSGAVVADGSLSLTSDQGLTVNNAGSITVTGGPGSATLAAGGGLSYAGGLATAGAASLTAGGALAFTGSASIGGDAVFQGGTTLGLGGTIAAAGDIAGSTAGTLTTGGQVTAGGALGLTAGGTFSGNGLLRAGTDATLTSGQAMSLQGTAQAGGDLVLRAGAGLTFAANGIAGGVADFAALGGDLALTSAVTAGTALTLRASGSITQAGLAQSGGTLDATAGGNLLLSGQTVAGSTLAMVANGNLSQTGLVQAGASATLGAGASLGLSGPVAAGADVTITAGGQATLAAGSIGAGGEVRLAAGGVALQSFTIGSRLTLLQTGGGMTVEGSALASGERIRLSAGSIALRHNSITTTVLDVDAAGSLALDGGTYVIGRVVAFSAPGGIATPGTITVRPRDGLLPGVVFDTRSAGATPDPILIVQPDQPGLPANQQPTQVRMPNIEAPGAFGPASSAGAGPVQIDIDAGRSAIFLLIDGGNATGNIVSAGRLGIHGTGGSAELTGRFVDANGVIIGGGGAARFGDSTRPAASGTLTRYRINGCVISSINCIVPSQILAIPAAPPQRVDLNIGGGRITDPDVQMPNVAEEDY